MRFGRLLKIVFGLVLLAGVAEFLLLAYAAEAPSINIPTPGSDAPIKEGKQIQEVIGKFAKYVAIIFWIAAAASAFYAGYLYLFAAGNQEMVEKANKQIWYTIIAIVIGLMAWGLPALIKSLISAPAATPLRPPPPPPGTLNV